MHEIRPHPVVLFPPRKVLPTMVLLWRGGVGAGWTRAQAAGTGKSREGPAGPCALASQQAVCLWGGVGGFRERLAVVLEGRG